MKISAVKVQLSSVLGVVFQLLALLIVTSAQATTFTSGSLNPGFGTGGEVFWNDGDYAFGSALAIDSQGRLVIAGSAVTFYTNSKRSYDFAVLRLNADGTRDSTFNGGGAVAIDINGSGSDDHAYAVALDSLGRIVVAGTTDPHNNNCDLCAGGTRDFALVRWNADGTLDTTFGNNGIVTTDISGSGSDDIAAGMTIDGSGKIVVAGSSGGTLALVRYNSDGTLDNTFNGNGKVLTDVNGINSDLSNGAALALTIDGSGNIVVAGYAFSTSKNDNDFLVARYKSDGSLDTNFNSTGLVATAVSGFIDQANAVVIDANGKIVAGGLANSGFGLVRYNSDGSLDKGFNSTGIVSNNFGGSNDPVTGVAIDSAGKIVAVGYATISTRHFAIARYNSDGTIDNTFGSSGETTAGPSGSDGGAAVAIDDLKRIIVAGSACTNTFCGNNFAIAEYVGYGADLGVTATADKAAALPGDTITYTITVSSNGPDDVNNTVTVTDALPGSLTFGSCSSTGGGVCGGSGNNRTITFPSMPADTSQTITLIATLNYDNTNTVVVNGTPVVNTVSVAGATLDWNPANNTARASTTIDNYADASITKSLGTVTSAKGKKTISYTITVANPLNSFITFQFAARALVMTDTTPTGTTFNSITPPAGWTCTAPPAGSTGTVSCTTFNLNYGSSSVFTVILNITAKGKANVTNTATVGTGTFDPTPGNNTATVSQTL